MNVKSIVTFALITIGVLVGVTALLWNFGAQPKGAVQIADIAGEMKHKKGEGPVVITEFSDFQCPGCKAIQEPLKQLLTKYEGKVTFVYRHFPLVSIHKNSMISAQAAEAASLQGKFWEMHDLLFVRQNEWGTLSDPKEKFGEYATELKLDKTKFMSDLDATAVKEAVAIDNAAANKNALSGTPTFFVNGYETDFTELEVKIEELSK